MDKVVLIGGKLQRVLHFQLLLSYADVLKGCAIVQVDLYPFVFVLSNFHHEPLVDICKTPLEAERARWSLIKIK